MAIPLHFTAFVGGIVVLQECLGQIFDQFANLFLAPLVLALVLVNGVFLAFEQFADVLSLALDIFHHRLHLRVTACDRISASRSSASISYIYR